MAKLISKLLSKLPPNNAPKAALTAGSSGPGYRKCVPCRLRRSPVWGQLWPLVCSGGGEDRSAWSLRQPEIAAKKEPKFMFGTTSETAFLQVRWQTSFHTPLRISAKICSKTARGSARKHPWAITTKNQQKQQSEMLPEISPRTAGKGSLLPSRTGVTASKWFHQTLPKLS